MRNHLPIAIIVLAILIPAIGLAVSVEVGQTGGAQPRQERIIPAPPFHNCNPDSAVSCVNGRAEIGKPIRVGRLWVFPIVGNSCGSKEILSMDRALSKGDLRITEQGGGSVNTLQAQNHGRHPVFLMAGEVLVGGKQNRIVAQDVLVPPFSGPISIQVFCGEQQRWTHAKGGFSGKGLLAPSKLRSRVMGGASQNEVWSGIADRLDRHSVSAPTQDMQQIYEQSPAAKEARKCVRTIRRKFPRNTIGMILFLGARSIGIEVFSDASMFTALHEKVLAATMLDHGPIGCKRPPGGGFKPSMGDARRALDRVLSTNLQWRPTTGAGCLFNLTGHSLTGQVLTFDGGLVHLGAAEQATVFGLERR
jgi:ARG and Rhodanese-Phosphatase-superfamily-associated Protein domain